MTKEYGLHKVVILGTPGSGKTTLMVKLSGANNFDEIKRTIGVDFHVVRKLINDNLRLQIWDLAGQAHFRDSGIFEDMVHGASVFLICYDASNSESIKQIDKWLEIAKTHNRFSETKRYLVGLKVDQVSIGQQVALSNLIQKYIGGDTIQKHFLLSSFEDIGIEIMIENLSEDLINLAKSS
jgi:small GTP-binding protein